MKSIHTALAKVAVLAVLAAAAGTVAAADSQNLNITASVTAKCKFSSGVQTFGFGTLDPSAAVLASGSGAAVTYKCTKGTVATGVTADSGLHALAGSNRMSNSTDFIPYSLTITGDTQTGAGFGAGKDLTLTLAGSVLAADYENVSAGSYTDTVVLSILP